MFAEINKHYLTAEGAGRLPFVVCTIGSPASQNPISRPEGFCYHHMLWVTEGQGLFEVGGQKMELAAGEGLFCRKHISHAYSRSGDKFATHYITFLGGDGVLDYYHVPDFFVFRVGTALAASSLALEKLCLGNSHIISRSAAGYQWLVDWLEREFSPQASPDTLVKQYLENHFAQPLTLEEIGAQVQMDRYTLCRYFREKQGMTVMEQLKRIRIAKAKQFLRYASCSIEEAGKMCGYLSPSYFGKIFREETGQTPREYRETHIR